MGAKKFHVYDEDGVSIHNIPNQFYRKQDVRQFKVDSLKAILGDFAEAEVSAINHHYVDQKLDPIVIVATDSMSSRKVVWEQFKKQKNTKYLIEARMGAELGVVYTITKSAKDKEFYEETLYDDNKVKPLPCTARTIIYNVLMISSLICRAFKSIIQKEQHPREIIFNMTSMDGRSYMHRM